MVIKPAQTSQYSNNPQIPKPIIDIVITDKGTASDGRPIKDVTCHFKGWNKSK